MQRGNHIWRRRQCKGCNALFTTRELPSLDESIIVEYDVKLPEAFSRDRLFLSVYESCKHRTNALSDATGLTKTIIDQLVGTRPPGSLHRDVIAYQTYMILKRFDAVAATVYAAFHAVA